VVESGAVVREAILLPGSVVRSGAKVERAILDDAVEICAGARVGEAGGEIALVGQRAVVDADTELGGGARFPHVE
jgi:glucose-1-phosphate adenylyltransferase